MSASIRFNLGSNSESVKIEWQNIESTYKLYSKFEDLFHKQPLVGEANLVIHSGYFLQNIIKLRTYWVQNIGKIEDFYISEDLISLYKNIPTYDDVVYQNQPLEISEIQTQLLSLGWGDRILTNNQLRNISKIANLPAAADFSIPGAGKTTEALAINTLRKKNPGDKTLIICPKNAFTAWEEDIPICMSAHNKLISLKGDILNIEKLLRKDANFYMINYERLRHTNNDGTPSYAILISNFISNPEHNFSIIADESHRMKGNKTSEIMQILAPLTLNKMVLSGTPCPQSHHDLISQFRFLYPKEQFIDAEDIAEKFQPIFVRTTKNDLKDELPELIEEYRSIEYSGTLKDVYDLFKGEVINNQFNINDRNDLRALGKIVIKLIRLCANPQLVLRDVYLINPGLADLLAEEGMGPKIKAVLKDARNLMHEGNKVIIWSSFPDSIDQICDVLESENFHPVKIHGKIPMGDDKSGHVESGTRRFAIHEFKTNPKCMAFVANPMAAGEGISLHHVCRHALYVDRSFNVAHYLQSKDRIHRIGGDLSKEVIVKVYALAKMIDSRVNERLSEKTKTMSDFLNDRSILTNFIDYDIDFDNAESEFLSGDENLDTLREDLEDVYNFLREE